MQQLQPNTLLQGGQYKIIDMLGQGGFGITYLAVQSGHERQGYGEGILAPMTDLTTSASALRYLSNY